MTEIGIVGNAPVVVVSAAGTLSPIGGDRFFDWWVGADDRWHHASTEAAVRQRIAADDAALETRLRIPGGDAVSRVIAVPDQGSGAVLVELRNDSPVPVAVAVVLKSAPADLEVVDDEIRRNGTTILRASRPLARVLVADDDEEARAGVAGGAAFPPIEGDWPKRGSVVVAIMPLPHTAALQISLASPLADDPSPAPVSAVDALPPFHAVARGWELHLGRGARVAVPDDRVTQAAAAARRHLLIGSAQPVSAPFWTVACPQWAPAVGAAALDAWGHVDEARELLLAASGVDDLTIHAGRSTAEAGALLWAWAERLERRPEPELEAVLAPWIEQVAIGLMRRPRRFGRRREEPGEDAWRAVGLAAAGSLLSRLGDDDVGPDIVDALPALTSELDTSAASIALALGASRLGAPLPGLGAAIEHHVGLPDRGGAIAALVAAMSDSGALPWHGAQRIGSRHRSKAVERSGTSRNGAANTHRSQGRSQHPAMSALFLLGLARALVAEPEGAGGPIALLSEPPGAWLGSPVEAHGFPVAAGTAAFGVRWHGGRPALLWDIGGSVPRTVRAPGLDDTWSDERPKGEALLSPTPSLHVESGPESPEVRRGEPRDGGDDPDSFS